MADFNGRQIFEYVDEVNELVRNGRDVEAESLLLHLVDATEAQDADGVAPWYFERLAIIYRKRHDLDSEIGILERYASNQIAPGAKPRKLMERLEKARAKKSASVD